MKYKINWKNIKNGYKGFEALAVKYVQTEYDSRFSHTKDTRDGNKDAVLEDEIYTIILGYQSIDNSIEEWWMEAKYTESKSVLPRYRLDATLVSAILKGNVRRLFFVTNTNISSQVVNDIRQAIIGTTICKEVNFCMRNTLEYWLYQNTDILIDFFPEYNNTLIELENLILVDKVKYYTGTKINCVFKENLHVLDLGQVYRAEFTVFSSDSVIFNLQADQRLQGIKLITSRKLTLQKGINNIQFDFYLKENYGYKSKKKNHEHMLLPEPAFRLGTVQIISDDNVVVNKTPLTKYELSTQKNVKKEIVDFFSKSNKTDGTSLFYLHGQSGTGKSYILNNYLDYKGNTTCPCFYCEMSGNYSHDLKNVIDFINYIYFPFIPSKSITADYLDQFTKDNYIPTVYKQIIRLRDSEEELSMLFSKYISQNISLFPQKLYINQRQMIVDNIHKTSSIIVNVFYKIVVEQSMINAPLQIIFSGQWIQYTEIYFKLSSTVRIKEKELCITVDDCLSILPCHTFEDKLKNYLNSNLLFSNIVEILMFSLYLHEHDKNIQDFETFQILYHLYFLENIMDLYIKRLFDNALSYDEDASALCNQIYWNSCGILRTDSKAERRLLCYHIVKLDVAAQRVVPYNDLYTKCYRKNYMCNQLLEIPFVQLLETGNYTNIKAVASKLHEAYQEKNYILVYYTLEPIYINASAYNNLLDETTYYTLFQDFAHSCTFCSIDYSGGKLFERIYNETKLLYNPSQQIRLIHNAALWELTNSTFESLNYEQALVYCDELLNDTKYLVECGIIKSVAEDGVRFHNANVIKSMIKSELQEADCDSFFELTEQKMLAYHNADRLWSFRVRYSLTIMQRDSHNALYLLQQCQQYYESHNKTNEKSYLWSCFYISYIKMITNPDPISRYQEETNALNVMEKMKDSFFNDYRKMLYGLVLYLYYCNRKEEAELFLLKDCYVLREKRPRLKGFEHLIFALRYIIDEKNHSALEELKEAFTIFKHIPSYSNLIKHNIALIETQHLLITDKIKYYLGGKMESDIYYLDIRGCW